MTNKLDVRQLDRATVESVHKGLREAKKWGIGLIDGDPDETWDKRLHRAVRVAATLLGLDFERNVENLSDPEVIRLGEEILGIADLGASEYRFKPAPFFPSWTHICVMSFTTRATRWFRPWNRRKDVIHLRVATSYPDADQVLVSIKACINDWCVNDVSGKAFLIESKGKISIERAIRAQVFSAKSFKPYMMAYGFDVLATIDTRESMSTFDGTAAIWIGCTDTEMH